MKIAVTNETSQALLTPGMYMGTCVAAYAGLLAPYGKPDEEPVACIQFEFVINKGGQTYEVSTFPYTVYSRYNRKANFFKVLEALNGGALAVGDTLELPDLDEDQLPMFFTKGERPLEVAYIKANGEDLIPGNCLVEVSLNKDNTRNTVKDVKPLPVSS